MGSGCEAESNRGCSSALENRSPHEGSVNVQRHAGRSWSLRSRPNRGAAASAYAGAASKWNTCSMTTRDRSNATPSVSRPTGQKCGPRSSSSATRLEGTSPVTTSWVASWSTSAHSIHRRPGQPAAWCQRQRTWLASARPCSQASSFEEMFTFVPSIKPGLDQGLGVYRVGSPNGELVGHVEHRQDGPVRTALTCSIGPSPTQPGPNASSTRCTAGCTVWACYER
jgi:hypothetical protein